MGIRNGKLVYRSNKSQAKQMFSAPKDGDLTSLGVKPGEWHHVVFVIDRTAYNNSKIYIDGLDVGTFQDLYPTDGAKSGNIDFAFGGTRCPLSVGANGTTSLPWSCEGECEALLDDIRVYHRALAPFEISILYHTVPPGTGNINADPCFVDANGPDGIAGTEDDNLSLLSNSPCIDAGDNNSVPPDYADLDGDGDTTEPTPLDLDYRPRFMDGDCNDSNIVDMGAYEFRSGGLATNPNPVNNATGIPRTGTILSWTAGVGATGHDVYLDTVNPPVIKVSNNQPGITYAIPGTLANKTKYYWRIDEKDICGTTTGTVWNFTSLCKGDFTADGFVKIGDIQALVSYWNNNKDGFGKAPLGMPGYVVGMDLNNDGWIKLADIQLLVSYWNNNKDGFGKAPCMP
jgi:hypothetical protein